MVEERAAVGGALVTAGARRVGKSLALRLATLGYDIALHYCESKAEAEATASEIIGMGRRCRIFHADFHNEEQLQALVPSVLDWLPELSVLVNNASMWMPGKFADATLDELSRYLRVHVEAPFELTRAFSRFVRTSQNSVANSQVTTSDSTAHSQHDAKNSASDCKNDTKYSTGNCQSDTKYSAADCQSDTKYSASDCKNDTKYSTGNCQSDTKYSAADCQSDTKYSISNNQDDAMYLAADALGAPASCRHSTEAGEKTALSWRTGHVINIIDCNITRNKSENFAYLLSKKALADFTLMAAVELAPSIRVNAIAPGAVLPPDDERKTKYAEKFGKNPLERPGSPDDVADALEFLLKAQHISGQIIFPSAAKHLL